MKMVSVDELAKVLVTDAKKEPEGGWRTVYGVPIVDAEPVRHGHWIRLSQDLSECSVCGYYSRDRGNYCTHCGAKMVEEVAE